MHFQLRAYYTPRLRKFALAALTASVLLASNAAYAQNIMDLMPPGWKLENLGGWGGDSNKTYGGRTFLAPDGVTAVKVDHVNGADGLNKAAENARDYLRPYGGEKMRETPASLVSAMNAYVAAGSWQDDDGVRTMGLAAARKHPAGRTWVCSFRTRLAAQIPPALTKWLNTCMAAADQGYFVYEDDAKAAAARAKIASVPIKPGLGRPIEATLLDLEYITGVGGMVLLDYRPIVLFKDGTAVRNFEQPVADIDVAQYVKAQPDDVTRWTRVAGGYSIHWPDEDEADVIKDDFERPKVFPAGHKLNDYWKRLSGGGNTALGGDVMVAVSNGYRFFADGRFSTDSAFSGSTPGVFTGSGKDGGTYGLNGSGLTLTYGNGTVKKFSLYYGGAINDPVLWLGGRSYTN
jgi:hypothetical protein